MFDHRFHPNTLPNQSTTMSNKDQSASQQQRQSTADDQWRNQSPAHHNHHNQNQVQLLNNQTHEQFINQAIYHSLNQSNNQNVINDQMNHYFNHQSNNSSNHVSHNQQVRQMLVESAWNNQQLPRSSILSRTSSSSDHTPSHLRSPSCTSGSNTPSESSSLSALLLPDSASMIRRQDSAGHSHESPFYHPRASPKDDVELPIEMPNDAYPFSLHQLPQQSDHQHQRQHQSQHHQQNEHSQVSQDPLTTSALAQQVLTQPPWYQADDWNQLILQSPVTVDLLGRLFTDDTNQTFELSIDRWGEDFIQRARMEVVTHVQLTKPFLPAIHAVEAVRQALNVQETLKQQLFDFRRCTSENLPRQFVFPPSSPSGNMFAFETVINDMAPATVASRTRNLSSPASHISSDVGKCVQMLPEQPAFNNSSMHNRQMSAPASSLTRSPDLNGPGSMMNFSRDLQNMRTDSQHIGMHAASRGMSLSPLSFDSAKRRRRRSEELAESERWKCSNPGCWRFYRKSSTASIRSHQQSCPQRALAQQVNQASSISEVVSQTTVSPRPPARSQQLQTLPEDPEMVIFRDD